MADTGRPTVMDKLTLQKLEEAYSNDATDVQACFLANIAPATLYNYQKEHPEFIERKHALKDMTAYQAKIVVRESIVNNDKETSKWYLEKKEKSFKPKQDITSDDKPLPLLYGISSDISNEKDTEANQEN